jgi:putative transposase
MPDFSPWHHRGYLPHYDDGKKIQSITYRLADALPADVIAKLEEQSLDDEKRRAEIEHYLDVGHGSCLLHKSAHPQAVIDTWRHFDGERFLLHAWVVMPNHVHVLVEPLPGFEIGEIVEGWKSVSAREILRAEKKGGRFAGFRTIATEDARAPRKKGVLWQLDYWDRFIRSERHYRVVREYIHQNPVQAGLVAKAEDWPWSTAATARPEKEEDRRFTADAADSNVRASETREAKRRGRPME